MGIQGDERADAPSKIVKMTKYAMFIILALIVGYDVVVAYNPWRGDTISEVTLGAALRSLTIPAAWGIITGHLFWPGKKRPPVWSVLTFFGIVLSFCIPLDILVWKGLRWQWLMFIHAYPIMTVLVFIPLGRVFWQQARQ